MPKQILTSDGYKKIEDISIGDKIIAFDVFTGAEIENEVLDKTLWDFELDEEGNRKIKEFTGKFYRINGKWDIYEEQSIWRNDNQVVHGKHLVIGDIIFDENDQDTTVTSIEEVTGESWWKLHISGDASFISDGVTLHNASRFWVGGTGTWDNVTTTHWSATTGGAGGASVPGSADLVNFDASSGGGTVTLTYSPTVAGITGGAHTGTLALGANSLTMSANSAFNYSGTGARTLNLGSATINLVGGASGGWNCSTSTNMTLIAGTSLITSAGLQNSSFQGGSLTYNNVTIGTGGGGCSFTGSNTFNDLTFSPISSTGRMLMDFNQTQTVTGTFTAAGTSSTSIGMVVVRGTGTNVYAGITSTINAANVSISNVIFVGIIGTGAGTWSGTNIGNGGSCTGITFTPAVNRHWVATSGGNYAATTSWSATSGGASGASIPLPQDTVFFNSNSITSATRTITLNHCAFPSLDFSALLNAPTITYTLTNGSMYFFGDIIMGSNVTSNGSSGMLMIGTVTQNINLQGHTFGTSSLSPLNIQGTNVVLTGDWTASKAITLIAGTFNANGFNVTCETISNTTQNITRAIIQGSGQWILTGSNATIWSFGTITGFTFTKGTKPIICNYSGATGIRSIVQGSFGGTFGKASYPDFNITAGTDAISISSSRVGSLDFTGFSGSLQNNTRVVFGDFKLSSTMSLDAGTLITTFGAETGDAQIITSNGNTMDFPVNFGVQATGSGSVTLADNAIVGTTRTATLQNGTFDIGAFTLTTGIYSVTGTNVRTITGTTGSIILTSTGSVWNATTVTNLTVSLAAATIKITDTSAAANTFVGGGKTYGNLWFSRGASTGQNILTGSNNFADIKDDGSVAHSFLFTAGTTTGFTSWSINGNAGNLISIASVTAATHTLKNNGSAPVVANYLNITNSIAT